MKDKIALLKELKIDRAEMNREPSRSWIKYSVGLLSFILVCYFVVRGFQTDAEEPSLNQRTGLSTEVIPIEGDVGETDSQIKEVTPVGGLVLSAAGYVVARRVATVSAEVTGRINNIFVEESDVVEEGQLLATLDDVQANLNLKLARTRLISAKAEVSASKQKLSEAERILQRQLKLFDEGFSTEAVLTDLKTNVGTLSAELERNTAALSIAELEIKQQEKEVQNTQIIAPFSGVVVDKSAQIGEIISPISGSGGFTRTGICTLVDMGSLEIEVDVNEAYIGRLRQGQTVIAKLSAYDDWDIDAKLIAIVPTADRSKGTVRVRIGIVDLENNLSNDGRKILPEMAVNVDFYNKN